MPWPIERSEYCKKGRTYDLRRKSMLSILSQNSRVPFGDLSSQCKAYLAIVGP